MQQFCNKELSHEQGEGAECALAWKDQASPLSLVLKMDWGESTLERVNNVGGSLRFGIPVPLSHLAVNPQITFSIWKKNSHRSDVRLEFTY